MEEVDDYNYYHIAFKFNRESNVERIVKERLPLLYKTGKYWKPYTCKLCTVCVDTDK